MTFLQGGRGSVLQSFEACEAKSRDAGVVVEVGKEGFSIQCW